jgi:glycosyltransferase involved in cell wall biosynthesis
MDIPHGWKVVVNSSAGHYSTEKYDMKFINTSNNIINLQKDFLEERDFSLLLSACDVILLPYRITSGSGVMFDALSHGIPFIAPD